MSLFILKSFTLLIFVFGDTTANCDDGLNHLLSENDGDLKGAPLDERTFTRPTTFRPTLITGTSLQLQPTPTPRPTQSVRPTAGGVIALPPAAPAETEIADPICGKKRNCYQWFDDEIDLALDGYQRCNVLDERRARRYCCRL